MADPTPETLRKLHGMMLDHVAKRDAGIVPAKRVPTRRCRICGTHFDFQMLRFPGEPRQGVCTGCQTNLDSGKSVIVDKGMQDANNCTAWFTPEDPSLAGKIEFVPSNVFKLLREKLGPALS